MGNGVSITIQFTIQSFQGPRGQGFRFGRSPSWARNLRCHSSTSGLGTAREGLESRIVDVGQRTEHHPTAPHPTGSSTGELTPRNLTGGERVSDDRLGSGLGLPRLGMEKQTKATAIHDPQRRS
jgi:hypothetical protein